MPKRTWVVRRKVCARPRTRGWSLVAVLLVCGCATSPPPGFFDPDGGVWPDGSTPNGETIIAVGDYRSGTVASSDHNYRLLDVPPGEYALLLTNLGGLIDATVYQDDVAMPLADNCGDGGCLFTSPGGTVRIRLDSIYNTAEDYTIAVLPVETVGTPSSPVMVGPDELYSGVLPANQSSYFSFEVPTAGTYLLDVHDYTHGSSMRVAIEIYADADFGGTPLTTCVQFAGSVCKLYALTAGTYGARAVERNGAPAIYDWKVWPGLAEGAPSERVALTLGEPRSAGIDAYATSYYTFTTAATDGGVLFTSSATPAALYVDVLELGSGTTVQSCWTPCEVGGLSGSTTYALNVHTSNDNSFPYDLTASTGTAVGTPTAPMDFPVDVDVPIALGRLGTSYYRFNVPLAGTYYATWGAAAPGTGDLKITFDLDPTDGSPFPDATCTADGCTFQIAQADADYLMAVSAPDTAVDRTLRLTKSKYGNGSFTSPLPAAIGESYTVDFNGTNGSVFEFTTDSNGTGVVIAFDRTEVNVSFGVLAIYPDCVSNLTYYQRCAITGLAPDTAYAFSVAAPAFDGASMHIFGMDTGAGCAPGALRCDDYESGSLPGDYVEPLQSDGPWSAAGSAAIRGSFGVRPSTQGSVSLSCFEVTIPEESWAVAFSTTTNLYGVYNGIYAYIDGTRIWPAGMGDATNKWRWVINSAKALGHVYTFCFDNSGSAPESDIDDLEFY